MKFYYDNIGYTCRWKNLIKDKNLWFNMEPVKLSVRLPIDVYGKIIQDTSKMLSISKNHDQSILLFKIYKEKSEQVTWCVNSSDDSELWEFTTLLDRVSYTSKFNDGTVTAIFDFYVKGHKICERSELRELLLNQLI